MQPYLDQSASVYANILPDSINLFDQFFCNIERDPDFLAVPNNFGLKHVNEIVNVFAVVESTIKLLSAFSCFLFLARLADIIRIVLPLMVKTEAHRVVPIIRFVEC